MLSANTTSSAYTPKHPQSQILHDDPSLNTSTVHKLTTTMMPSENFSSGPCPKDSSLNDTTSSLEKLTTSSSITSLNNSRSDPSEDAQELLKQSQNDTASLDNLTTPSSSIISLDNSSSGPSEETQELLKSQKTSSNPHPRNPSTMPKFTKSQSEGSGLRQKKEPTILLHTNNNKTEASSPSLVPPLTPTKKKPLKSCLSSANLEAEDALPSDASSSSSPRRTLHKSVSFCSIGIREHPRIVGDHPAVSKGCPLGLDWYDGEQPEIHLKIDDYEASRPRRRTRQEICMPSSVREDLLREAGASTSSITKATQQAQSIQERRRRTQALLPLEPHLLLLEKMKRKWQRVRRARPKTTEAEVEELYQQTRRGSCSKGKLKRSVSTPVFSSSGKQGVEDESRRSSEDTWRTAATDLTTTTTCEEFHVDPTLYCDRDERLY